MRRFLTAAVVFYSFVLIKTNIAGLPVRIPTHFKMAGEANGWGSPNMLWVTLLLQVVTCSALLTAPVLSRRFPGLAHVGSRRLSDFSPAQQERILPLLTQWMEYLSVLMSLLFAFLLNEIIGAASSSNPHISIGWAIAAFLGGNAAILIYYMRRINAVTKGVVAD